KSISVKAGSFNAITVEKFSLLTAVVCDVKMNWGRILFGFLKKMVTPGTKQAKGFAIQISLLLESVPNLELGASSEFPSSKILTDKTIHRYIAVIDKSCAQDPADAPKIKKAPMTKAASKKRPAGIPLDVPVVKRKRTSKKKSTLKLVAVAQEAIPIQIVPAESVVGPMVEDQQTETEDAADRPATEEETPADYQYCNQQVLNQLACSTEERDAAKGDRVETWFDRALAEEFATAGGDSPTEKANDEIPWFVHPFLSADHDNERLFETGSDSVAAMDFEVHSQNLPVVKDTFVDPTGEQEIPVFEEQLVDSVNEGEMQDKTVQSAEAKIDKDEAMSLEDLILSIPADIPVPSASIEITKIKMGTKIQIPGVDEKLCYLASLPKITDDDKGKALLVEKDPVKGHPAREHYFSICANIDLLVKLREQIIEEVDRVFHSFSFKKLASINIEEMSQKEDLVLSWGETESIHEALRRKRYILLKYREMLVRKYLESWKKNFKPGGGTSATDLQVIAMLWERHLDVLQELSKQKITHGLLWDRPCCSANFQESPRDRGAVISRTNTNTPSRCWIRTMIYVDGVWTIVPCADHWVKIPQMVFSNEVPRQRQYDDTLPSVSAFFRLMRKRWADVCLEDVEFCTYRRLLPVGSLQFCKSLSVVEPGYRVAPRQSSVFAFRVSQFCSVFVDFSVFSCLPTTDITDFLSSIALERTVLRNVQRSVSIVHPNKPENFYRTHVYSLLYLIESVKNWLCEAVQKHLFDTCNQQQSLRVELVSLGVHKSAACVGGCLQRSCNHQSLIVIPSEEEEGET
ncbi:lysine-specific demethylase rbr-2, partial [Dorcoceras hygrometricum]